MRVTPTGHAVRALSDRSLIATGGARLISEEVAAAVLAGRKAKTMPRWCVREHARSRKKIHDRHSGNHPATVNTSGKQRYVWNLEQTRVYVLRIRMVDGVRDHVVLTTLVPEALMVQ